jgi:alpha-ketoglutarate-dependent taurine dioxygenase
MSSKTLPYVWRNDAGSDINAVLDASRTDIDALLHEHGAILFKGFGLDTIEKFQACTAAMPSSGASYIDGNSPRTKLTSSVYTSTEFPPELPISMHNELSYSHSWPSRLYFCCIKPAHTGGSTTVADGRALLAALSPETLKQFEERGVTYVRNLHGGNGMGKSWQSTFETPDRSVVEAYCKAGDIDFSWSGAGDLRLVQHRPATAVHPVTGDKVWFNQVDQFHPSTNPPDVYEAIQEIYGDTPFEMPQYGCFGDGSPIPEAMLDEVRAAAAAQTVAFEWEQGDMMMIDNMLTLHGRSPFTGTRKILVAMSS